MKNILASLVFCAGAFSSAAFATPISTGVPIQAGNAGCSTLAEAVTINLSSNVSGAYTCDVNNNVMRVATCHRGGSRKQATVNCAIVNVVTNDDNTTTNVWNDSTCSDAKAAAATAQNPHTFESSSLGKAFTASTAGGSVAATSLTQICESSAAADAVLN